MNWLRKASEIMKPGNYYDVVFRRDKWGEGILTIDGEEAIDDMGMIEFGEWIPISSGTVVKWGVNIGEGEVR